MGGETVVDPGKSGPKEWDKPTEQPHQFQIKLHHGDVLEMEDVLFHLDSAVMMPDYDPDEPGREEVPAYRISGLAVLRACYQHVDGHPNAKILVTGHTDLSGTAEHNLKLSRMRAANVVHALLGEEDAWVQLALKQSRVEDYQQVLRWVARGWGWRCDPGPIDNILGPLTRRAVRAFQGAYNVQFKASIGVDGVVGKETWGAFFRVYMEELAAMMETDAAGLGKLRAKVHFVKGDRKSVGCGKHFPIRQERKSPPPASPPPANAAPAAADAAKPRDVYRSKLSRRVEILFFEPGHEPALDCHPDAETCLPEKCVIHRTPVYRFQHVVVDPAPQLTWLHLQTVDDFGFRVPDTDLVLRPEYGKETKIKTDEGGYWSGRIRADGSISVFLSDGKTPAYFAAHARKKTEAPSAGKPAEEKERPAVIDPRLAATTIADLVVPAGISDEAIKRRQALVQRFGRIPATGKLTRRAGNTLPADGEPAKEMSQRGRETPKGDLPRYYRRAYGDYIADNLFMAAGWTRKGELDLQELVKLLPEWLKLYHPSAARNPWGYHLDVLADRALSIVTHDGGKVAGQVTIDARWTPRARIGMYTPFQCFQWVYRDMYTQTTDFLVVPSSTGEGDATSGEGESGTASGTESAPPEAATEGNTVQIQDVISRDGQELFLNLMYGDLAGQVSILFQYPLPGVDVWLARHGGTGLLENYSDRLPSAARDALHDRNLAVVKSCIRAYEAYASGYIEKVKKTKTESELHKLGPPDSPFAFPEPVGVTSSEMKELRDAGATTRDFSAWKAVATHLCELYGVHGDGDMWLRFEFELSSGKALSEYVNIRAKFNFETTAEGHIKHTSTQGVVSTNVPWNKNGVDYKLSPLTAYINPETGAQEYKLNFAAGHYAFELNATTGEIKAGVGPLFIRTNERIKQIGFGGQLSLRDLLKLRRQAQLAQGVPADKCLDPEKYPDVKMAVGIQVQLLEEATVMSFLMATRGFFERRPSSELLLADWASLDTDERSYLTELGWGDEISTDSRLKPLLKYFPPTSRIWDFRHIIPLDLFPKSTRTFWTQLTYAQKRASLNLLGATLACEANWLKFWKSVAPAARTPK